MQEQYVRVLPKSSIGKALGYSIERWNELAIYAGDGKLNIDNNPVENSIRPGTLAEKIICLQALMKPHSAAPCFIHYSAPANFMASIPFYGYGMY